MKEKREINKKKILTLIIAIIIIIIIVSIFIITKLASSNKSEENIMREYAESEESKEEKYVEITEDGVKKNKSSKFKESKTEKGIEIDNIQISAQDGLTTVYADVTNKTGKNLETAMVSIIFLDDQENEITTVGVGIGDMEVDEKATIQAQSTIDFANVYDFKLVVE